MINNFIRIVHSSDYFADILKQIDPGILHQEAFVVTKSKLTTNDFGEGKSPIDILDESPEGSDLFCTVLIATEDVNVYFDKIEDNEYYNHDLMFPMHNGDLLSYFGIAPSKIEPLNTNNEPFKIFKFKVIPKQPKGKGLYKYKLSITFSDTYEIEIFANTENEAKEQALIRGFSEWDHLYDYVNKDKIKEYQSQRIRHSVWHPDQIKIEKI